jgi:hypothetical protein
MAARLCTRSAPTPPQGSGFLREKQVRLPTHHSRYLLGSYELRIFELEGRR